MLGTSRHYYDPDGAISPKVEIDPPQVYLQSRRMLSGCYYVVDLGGTVTVPATRDGRVDASDKGGEN